MTSFYPEESVEWRGKVLAAAREAVPGYTSLRTWTPAGTF